MLEHPKYGEAARELWTTAQEILGRIVTEKRLRASGVYGFWPAASEGNVVVLYEDAARQVEACRLPMLRQQQAKTDDRPYLCLADFVAPAAEAGLRDHVGAFAVTAGIGVEALVKEYEAKHDDYSAIVVKALADRLAEAFAELLHQRARREWGYGADERLAKEDLEAERYRGIRPAYGYPACPDHSENGKLFDLLQARAMGLELTEHFAMTPAASVSGLYFAHPQARYFAVGKIDRDQVERYARDKRVSIEEAERWLAPNLGYEQVQKVVQSGQQSP